jgi:hypothetical protein
MENLTLAALLTAAGAVTAAAIVRTLTELLKRTFPMIDARISGAALAFILCAALYVFAFVTIGPYTPEGGFVAFLAWLSASTSAVGINSTIDHVQAVRSGTRAIEDDPVPLDETVEPVLGSGEEQEA